VGRSKSARLTHPAPGQACAHRLASRGGAPAHIARTVAFVVPAERFPELRPAIVELRRTNAAWPPAPAPTSTAAPRLLKVAPEPASRQARCDCQPLGLRRLDRRSRRDGNNPPPQVAAAISHDRRSPDRGDLAEVKRREFAEDPNA